MSNWCSCPPQAPQRSTASTIRTTGRGSTLGSPAIRGSASSRSSVSPTRRRCGRSRSSTSSATSTIATRDPEMIDRARAEGRLWHVDTGHDLMITEPQFVADALERDRLAADSLDRGLEFSRVAGDRDTARRRSRAADHQVTTAGHARRTDPRPTTVPPRRRATTPRRLSATEMRRAGRGSAR